MLRIFSRNWQGMDEDKEDKNQWGSNFFSTCYKLVIEGAPAGHMRGCSLNGGLESSISEVEAFGGGWPQRWGDGKHHSGSASPFFSSYPSEVKSGLRYSSCLIPSAAPDILLSGILAKLASGNAYFLPRRVPIEANRRITAHCPGRGGV